MANEKMKYVAANNPLVPLTNGKVYEIIAWQPATGGPTTRITGIVVNDNGNLYTAEDFQDTNVWEIVRV